MQTVNNRMATVPNAAVRAIAKIASANAVASVV